MSLQYQQVALLYAVCHDYEVFLLRIANWLLLTAAAV